MRTDDFDYNLPPELIAQAPANPRDSCRLMVLDRETGTVTHRVFSDIGEYLNPGDLLVVNETRVMPARLFGNKVGTGGAVEVLLLHPMGEDTWECLVRPGKRMGEGVIVEFRAHGVQLPSEDPVLMTGEVIERTGMMGERAIRFAPAEGKLWDAIHECGNVPLPPYITQYHGDMEMYQTVYARDEKSAAAPTAGLHFTPELLDQLQEDGVRLEKVNLQVGIDTFRPVEEDDPRDHKMHTETYTVPQRVIDAVSETKAAGGRVIAVGTTSVRSLESCWDAETGAPRARDEEPTSLFIMPGYEFHVVDAMITNFHVPRSTLMMLVSAFAGREHILAAYEEAVRERYRLLSFGDAMFIS